MMRCSSRSDFSTNTNNSNMKNNINFDDDTAHIELCMIHFVITEPANVGNCPCLRPGLWLGSVCG
eukprot:scaffold160940_cov17-Prasinocladus_malaysianus.AAC.1